MSHSMIKLTVLAILIYFNQQIKSINGERVVSKKIYHHFDVKYYCIRLLNRDNQYGCSSNFSGNIGVLYSTINSTDAFDSDIRWILSEGPTPPYIVIITIDKLTTKLAEKLTNSSERVAGLLIINREQQPIEKFSPDSACPNNDYGLYTDSEYSECAKQKWNPDNPVLQLAYRDLKFPVVLVDNETDISNISHCINKFGLNQSTRNRTWPLCSGRLWFSMAGAVNSKKCISRTLLSIGQFSYCDPLGSRNIFSPLLPFDSSIANRSLIVLATRTDTSSFFFNKALGADSPLTSLITVFSVVSTLGRIRDKILSKRQGSRNILFALFNGEVYDYIGSSRMAFDLKHGSLETYSPGEMTKMTLPSFSLDHLSSFIELNQLAPHSSKDIWSHVDPISNKEPSVANAVAQLLAKLKKPNIITIKDSSPDKPLPPASLQSFLKEDSKIPGLVITNHDGLFENKYYNSFKDDVINIKYKSSDNVNNEIVKHLTTISTQLSQSIYELLTDEPDSSITSDPQIVNQLLDCFLTNISCSFFVENGFNASDSPSSFEDYQTFPMYTSIAKSSLIGFARDNLMAYLLAAFSGKEVKDVNEEACQDLKDKFENVTYIFIPGKDYKGICIESQVFLTKAESPIFASDEPNWDLNYSSWTESSWEIPEVSIFLLPDPAFEMAHLLIGLVVTTIGALIVRFVECKSARLFKSYNIG